MPFAVKQSCGSPSVAWSWFTRPFLGRRLFTSCPLPHPGEAACDSGWWYWHHPVQLSRWMQQRGPSLWPCPRQSWHLCWGRGRLFHVLCEFLGAGWVLRPITLNEAQCVTFIVYHYYVLLHIIASVWIVITCYYHFCYYTVITLLSRIITSVIINVNTYYYRFRYYTVLTLLLHYYYIFCYYTVITLLLSIITGSLLPVITISLLPNITSLLHHDYIMIMV